MKTNLFPALKLTAICILVFAGLYTAIVLGIAQIIAPNNGKGEIVNYVNSNSNLKFGFVNIGQQFTSDKYFWSRPSAVAYNAAGSGASNKGATNSEYLALVQARIDTFLVHNPAVAKGDIPVEMVTASGSGLDPHISPNAAMVQIARIVRVRNVSESKVKSLVNECTERPFLGMFGPAKVNTLKLNLALDNLK